MIVTIWSRYVTGSRWWLLLLGAVMALDLFLGVWITSLWLPYLKGQW